MNYPPNAYLHGNPGQCAPAAGRLGIRSLRAFTLVELLVAMAVLALMCVLFLSLISSAQRISQQTTSRVEQFREARRAFERINQRLSQATLNVYWDYVDSSGLPRTVANAAAFAPTKYARISELRYLQTGTSAVSVPFDPPIEGDLKGQAVFFQAPLGSSTGSTLSALNSLVNTVGYFVENGPDISSSGSSLNLRPPTVRGPAKIRYRLFELTEPADNLTVYTLTSGSSTYNGNQWFTIPLKNAGNSHRLADNIVALLFQAQYPLATGSTTQSYYYSSAPRLSSTQPIEENNLPPNVCVTMVAVDEVSGRRIQDQNILLPDAQDEKTLSDLETVLKNNRLNFRRFDATLAIGPAKWSAQ